MLRSVRRAVALVVLSGCGRQDVRPPAGGQPGAPVEIAVQEAARPASADERLDVGRADAPVTVIGFSEYGCHYCAAFEREVRPVIDREFVRAGRVRWRQVPIAAGTTPHARAAAAAALCAAEQGGFAAMHGVLFERRSAWMRRASPAAWFEREARALGLDAPSFATCHADPATAARVDALLAQSRALGVRLAPTFLVNGTRIVGYRSAEDFRALIAEALAAAGTHGGAGGMD